MDLHEDRKNSSETALIRNSGVELLKIIAMFAIVRNHMTQSVSNKSYYIDTQDYLIDLWNATTDIQTLVLICFRSLGAFGNTVFFISSAWFLFDSKKVKAQKCFSILLDVWIVSVIWLAVMMVLRSGNIEPGFVIRSLLPSLFGNNWYLTCYLLFYPFHTVYNSLIARFDRKTHLRVVIGLGIPFLIINSLKEELLYATELTTWIALYFLVAYIKKYHYEGLMKRKTSIALISIGITGFICEIVMTDLMGLHIGFFRHQMLHWGKNSNPFIIMTVLGLLSVFIKIDMKNKIINYISSLMMLVFIIHENIIFSAYMRPYFYVFIHDSFGYKRISLWVLIGSLSLFSIALVIAVIYDKTLRKIVKKISALLCDMCTKAYLKIEDKLIKA